MARVTYGESITEYAGSIGGVTYQKNASGNIARLRPKPTVNPTSLQANYQRIMALLVSHWPTVSQDNKDDWTAFAIAHDHTTPWGEVKTLSGYQWYLCVNLLRYPTYAAIRDDAPDWPGTNPPDQFIIETSSTYIRVAWSPNYDPAFSLKIYCSLPLRQSSLKMRRSLFLIANVPGLGSMANYDITTLVETLYNVTWADFYASANCHIIVRLCMGSNNNGKFSTFVSAITKIG